MLYETDGTGNLKTFYTRGAELISLQRTDEERYYLYDGHGSVRHLTGENGVVTDTYDYDAFGNLTEHTGYTENSYMYCGERYDANTGFYYLRARYMNPATGTFISMDSYQGSLFDPVSLHKYLYANANPVMNIDPTGYLTIREAVAATAILGVLYSMMITPRFTSSLFAGVNTHFSSKSLEATLYFIDQMVLNGVVSDGGNFIRNWYMSATLTIGYTYYLAQSTLSKAKEKAKEIELPRIIPNNLGDKYYAAKIGKDHVVNV